MYDVVINESICQPITGFVKGMILATFAIRIDAHRYMLELNKRYGHFAPDSNIFCIVKLQD